jgi:hypothetical protein
MSFHIISFSLFVYGTAILQNVDNDIIVKQPVNDSDTQSPMLQ